MPLNILHPFQLPVATTTTISELMEMVEIQVGISPARQSLFFRGQELAGDATLRDLGVPFDSTLILTVGDPTPASGHGFGGEGIHYNQDQQNSAANNSLQHNSAANNSLQPSSAANNSLNNMDASSYDAYNLQLQQPSANDLSAADSTLPKWIELCVMRLWKKEKRFRALRL
uniref:uncharacterized protein LOC105353028 n=1 Tax=Fragaria vesca subsp. vesca TaxID=101020 RepID=UPI0005C80119|nr:PREDICTED: uncharacterized protein LOC105353028 [Fragaria vesca subsp. vesca]